MSSKWPPPKMAAIFDDTSRLIPGPPTSDVDHALSDLVHPLTDLDDLVRLAGATNSRLQAQGEHHPDGFGREQVVFGIPYSKIINAVFANPGQGARFHSEHTPGAWYCAIELETAIAEVAFHRVLHLSEAGLASESGVTYRQYLADIHGQDFADLRNNSSAGAQSCLNPNSYSAGQKLGSELLEQGVGGIIYPSARHDGGTNIAVLHAAIVANIRQSALVTFDVDNGQIANAQIQIYPG